MMTNMKEEQHVIVCQHKFYDGDVFYTLEAIQWVPSHVRDEIEHCHFDSLELAEQCADDLNKVTLSELKKTL